MTGQPGEVADEDIPPSPPFSVTPAALAHILQARSDEPNGDSLAVWITTTTSGGTSKYLTWFQRIDDAPTDATVIALDGVSVVIPSTSVAPLTGSMLDVRYDGSGLTLVNPNQIDPFEPNGGEPNEGDEHDEDDEHDEHDEHEDDEHEDDEHDEHEDDEHEDDEHDEHDEDDYERHICGFSYEIIGGANSMLVADFGSLTIAFRHGGYSYWGTDEGVWNDISATTDDEARDYLRNHLQAMQDAEWMDISPWGLGE